MVQTKEEFKTLVETIQNSNSYKKPLGFGIARVDRGQKNADKVLQANFAVINWNENFGSAAIFMEALGQSGVNVDVSGSEFVATIDEGFVAKALEMFNPYVGEATADAHKNVQVIKHLSKTENLDKLYKIVFIFDDSEPQSVESVYLKLYALSLGKAKLRSLNLNGAFGKLTNVAWSGNTPYELDYLRENEIEMKLNGTYPVIDMVDKFPRLLGHVILADNTRILDSSKVRMGAQLAAGTTVMPGASYINFNAGTLGAVMVEGRISSSAVVGSGSDVGGGASILGVLSGTDGDPITIGENTLLGANSTTGVPLGDGCIVDGGLAVFAGTKFAISDDEIAKLKEVNPNVNFTNVMKAKDLAGLNGIHFRQDSQTGQFVVKRSTKEIKLNEELH
jgi:2,3,4,5-tetrahydropyridine-2-carboxylate N-succinyltransferase